MRTGFVTPTYSIIEHFFFPKFGASPNPFAFFAESVRAYQTDQVSHPRARPALSQPDYTRLAGSQRSIS